MQLVDGITEKMKPLTLTQCPQMAWHRTTSLCSPVWCPYKTTPVQPCHSNVQNQHSDGLKSIFFLHKTHWWAWDIRLNPQWIFGSILLTSAWRCVWHLQCSALQDITTTPAHTAASAVPLAPIRGSLARTTASPVQETQPQTSTAPPTSCSAKVRFFPPHRCSYKASEQPEETWCLTCLRATPQIGSAGENWEISPGSSSPPTTRGTTQPMWSAPGLSTRHPNAGSLLLFRKSTCP